MPQRLSLKAQLAVLVAAGIGLIAAVLAVYPRGWPQPDRSRPKEMESPALAVSVSQDTISGAMAALLADKGLQYRFGAKDSQWWNPLRGQVELQEVKASTLAEGAAVLQARAQARLTGWLPGAVHIDLLEATLIPTVLDDLQGNISLRIEPAVTNLQVREFGSSGFANRLNQLVAHLITEIAGSVDQDVEGVALRVDVKPDARAAHFKFEHLVVTAERDSLLLGAGPIVKVPATK